MTTEEYIIENKKRNKALAAKYNPITGEGSDCCKRLPLKINDSTLKTVFLPYPMMHEPLIQTLAKTHSYSKTAKQLHTNIQNIKFQFFQTRIRYDFEYWAFILIKIKEKLSDKAIQEGKIGKNIPFLLNRGQRKYLRQLYTLWLQRVPIRIILLKARQWGGSTLTQIFMMWMQMVQHTQWNSTICAHVETAARIVRGMYDRALENYPAIIIDNAQTQHIKLQPFQGSQKVRKINERDCTISIGSSERPEALRSEDINMAHFSEISSFITTENKKPEDIIQTVVSGIPPIADTIIVYESTAKGVGNFMHREWLRAKNHQSAFTPIFIAWFDIETYAKPIHNHKQFIQTLTEKEKYLFKLGATLEQIAWYRVKQKEYTDEWRFVSEFPSTDIEAFQSTGHRYYNIQDVERLRKMCKTPDFIGEIQADAMHGQNALKNITLQQRNDGNLKIWNMPDNIKMTNNRYVVSVDVNRGTSNKADNGVICVLDRYWQKQGGVPEVVAEWCGHIEMRYFIWKAVQIAVIYQNAFLVIESNTPESIQQSNTEMESVFDEIAQYYDNMYSRTPADQIKQGLPKRWGFRTNHDTKLKVCSHQQIVLRENLYIERSIEAADEHDTFEIKPNGALGAVPGCHDDRHITRAIGVWICYKVLPPPEIITQKQTSTYRKTIINEATF